MIGLFVWLFAGVGQIPTVISKELNLELGVVSEHPVSMDDYVLNAGDTLLVIIKGSFSYSYPTQITPTGQLMLMLPSNRRMTSFGQTWGDVSLVNLEAVNYVEIVDVPVKQARSIVAKAFSEYIRPVEVDFVLLGPRVCKINVTGEVQWPGSYLVTPFMRVEDALDQAGGITSMGSVSNITLLRRSGDSLKVNLRRYREDGKLEANPLLSDGDIIYVPKMEHFVLLQGAVFAKEAVDEPTVQLQLMVDTLKNQFHAEHWVEFEPGEKVCDFLEKRAVLLPQGDIAHSYIERGNERIFFDMQEYLATGKGENPKLEHGDIVTIPRGERFVYVTGEVRRPGTVIYDQSMTINQYLGNVGGFTSSANVRSVRVIYPDGRTRRSHPDMVLEPGSTIYVPTKPREEIRDWITFVAAGISLVTLIIEFGS